MTDRKPDGPYLTVQNIQSVGVFKWVADRRRFVATFWNLNGMHDARRHAEDFTVKLNAEHVEKQMPCTCHPSEAPVPCQHKYAYSECAAAAERITP